MKQILSCLAFLAIFQADAQMIHVEAESYSDAIGVQVETTAGTSAGKNVGYIDAGDWMEYPIVIPSTQSYNIYLRVASGFGGKTVGVSIDGVQIGTATVNNTGGWTTYVLTSAITGSITSGARTMRVSGVTDGFNVDFIQIIPTSGVNLMHASAGGDQSKPQGQTVTLDASFSWPGSTSITGYQWTRLEGSGGVITSPNSASTTVTDLPVGVHVFRVTTTAANASTSTDDVTITIAQCAGTKYSFLPAGDNGQIINGSLYAPGDTIEIRQALGGANPTWNYIYIYNLRGTQQCPIVIINNGIPVIRDQINLEHCHFVKMTGTGPGSGTVTKPTFNNQTLSTESMTYGFFITNTNASNSTEDVQQPAVVVGGRSKYVIIENFRVYKKTYIAWIKQDPACPPAGDSLNWTKWSMDHITIQNVHAYNIFQDGVYAGNTDPVGNRTYECASTLSGSSRLRTVRATRVVDGKAQRTTMQVFIPDGGDVPSMLVNTKTTARKPRAGSRPYSGAVPRGVSVHLIPMRLSNIRILNVYCDSANRSAIQLGGADSGYQEIARNVVRRAGYEENQQQGTGIWIGGLTSRAYMHDNYISCTFLYSFGCLGVEKNWMYNNRGDSAGILPRFPSIAGAYTGYIYNDERWINPGMYPGQVASYPSNVFLDNRPTWGPLGSVNDRGPEWDSSTVYVWGNRFGINVGGNHVWGYDTYNTFDRGTSIICNNTLFDGSPAGVGTRHEGEPQFSDFTYTTNCALIPTAPTFTDWIGGGGSTPENVKGWRKWKFRVNNAKLQKKRRMSVNPRR